MQGEIPMGKHLEDEQHDGICGHCRSSVPTDAIVCASCGARWGTSTGESRQHIYLEGKTKFVICSITCLAIAIFFLASAYLKSPWVIVPMFLGVFPGVPALGMAMGSLIKMWGAKRAQYTWWRDI